MAFISPDDGNLTVLNLFETDTRDGQDRLLAAMREIIDGADFEGWLSSTLHGGEDRRGTANYIQWRSVADLEARYAEGKFRHETVPLFNELATSVKLIQSEVVFAQRHPSLGESIEIASDRDDYTVIIQMGVRPDDQKELVEILAQPSEWLLSVPGYRSHTILRALDGTAVITYAQWDGKERYDAYHNLPEDERPAHSQRDRETARTLLTSRSSNSYRVVHSRSAV
jgi:heme-degrading monooxygenase HmoA